MEKTDSKELSPDLQSQMESSAMFNRVEKRTSGLLERFRNNPRLRNAIYGLGMLTSVAAMMSGEKAEAQVLDFEQQNRQSITEEFDDIRTIVADIAEKMGLDISEGYDTNMVGGVPVEINGIPVPDEALTPEQILARDNMHRLSDLMDSIASGEDTGAVDLPAKPSKQSMTPEERAAQPLGEQYGESVSDNQKPANVYERGRTSRDAF